MFNALIVNKDENGTISTGIEQITKAQLPNGTSDGPDKNVTVAIEFSTVNYKDGLCLGGIGGLVKTYPHVPGIDFAGTVEASDDARYAVGDKVVLTGWRVGEAHWGGYAQFARVNADWLVPLASGITTKQAMAIGTAGLAAMLGCLALEDNGLTLEAKQPILVTGASGGVGSIAAAILSGYGYRVAAVTGSPQNADYLTMLGASQIIARAELAETIKKPLESEAWAGCIDAVGGQMLARIIGQMAYGSAIAAIGNSGGISVPANIIPFLLRGIKLVGIDSTRQPFAGRRRAWQRLATDLDKSKLDAITQIATLSEVPELGRAILNGELRGRIVIDVNR